MKKEQYLIGMLCLLLVNFLLVASSVLTNEVLGHKGFHKPFFLTYVSSTIYIICLIPYLPLICNHCRIPSNRTKGYNLIKTPLTSEGSLDKNVKLPTEPLAKCVLAPPSEEVSNGQEISETMQGQNGKPRTSVEASGEFASCLCFVVEQSAEKMPLLETVKVSGILGSILFGMNYIFNTSLEWTTQGTNTVLSTLSGPFCLIFSLIFLKEPIVWSNMIGIAIVFGASSWIAWMDGRTGSEGVSEDEDISSSKHLLGNIFAILAAFIYGGYSVLLKFWIKDDSRLSMSLYLGLVGFWNVIGLWPLFFLFDHFGLETFQLPKKKTICFLVLNGFINVLCEICWTRAVLLISPTIASVSLGLSLPLSLLADYVIYGTKRDFQYILGTVCVIAGFVLANVKMRQRLEQESELQKPLCTEELLKNKE